MIKRCQPVLIVGLGTIGRLYAKILSTNNYQVLGIDANPEVVDSAINAGEILGGSIENDKEMMKFAKVVILSLAKEDVINWLKLNHHRLANNAIVIDTGTTDYKDSLFINGLLEKPQEYICTYPYISRKLELRRLDIKVIDQNSDEALQEAIDMANLLGFAEYTLTKEN